MPDADLLFPLTGRRIWVAGHRGMVGSALVRRLASEPCTVLTVPRSEVDLRHQAAVDAWMAAHRPDAVIVAAATVGGILANSTRPADFLYNNVAIAANVIEAARHTGVTKLLYLGSSCIYPKLADQPMAETALLTGALEPTCQWYAIAKITGLMLCQACRRQHNCDFISAMPTNLYGPGDTFDLQTSHVVPALIRKFHEAKLADAPSVTVWGTGTPQREFLHVDDLADALIFLLQYYSEEAPINVGSGMELTIANLAQKIAGVVGYQGTLAFDATKPDGTHRKLLDTGRLIGLGWRPRIDLEDGLAQTYAWYRREGHAAR